MIPIFILPGLPNLPKSQVWHRYYTASPLAWFYFAKHLHITPADATRTIIGRRRDAREQGGVDILFSCEIQEAGGAPLPLRPASHRDARPAAATAGERSHKWLQRLGGGGDILSLPLTGTSSIGISMKCAKSLACRKNARPAKALLKRAVALTASARPNPVKSPDSATAKYV